MSIFDMTDNDDLGNAAAEGNPASSADGNTANKEATKAYSERLNADRAKIAEEVKLETAKSFGFDSWEAFTADSQKKIIEDSGLDADKIKPVIDKLIASNPDVIAAKTLKATQETNSRVDKERAELFTLNSQYATTYKDVSELPDAVKDLYSKGVPLAKAYAVEHLDDVIKSQKTADPSKQHLQKVPSTNGNTSPSVITANELALFKRFNPTATDEQINAFVQKTRKR